MNTERLVENYQEGKLSQEELFSLIKYLNDAIQIIQRIHMLSNVANDRHQPQNKEMITINHITSDFVYKYEQIINSF